MSRVRLTVLIAAVVMTALVLFALILDAELNVEVLPDTGLRLFFTSTILVWQTFMTLTACERVDKRFQQLHDAVTEAGNERATEAAVAAITERQAIPVARVQPLRP